MIDLIPARPEMARMLKLQDVQLRLGQAMDEASLKAAIDAGVALAATDGRRILGMAGICELWPDRGLAWALLAEAQTATMLPIHRATAGMLAATPFRRVEAHVAVEHEAGARWMRLLGFEREGRMRAFWQGQDYDLYARVR